MSDLSSRADFCIEIDFEKGSESPSRVFRAMSELIEAFQEIDLDLVQSIDPKIEPIAIIEDVEAGSIRAWLKIVLKEIEDEALKKLDWKPQVGKYLVKAKYFLINYLEGKSSITTKEEIDQIETGLFALAEETEVRKFPAYTKINRKRLLMGLGKISSATKHLNEKDKAIFITADSETVINAEFDIVPEKLDELITKETIEHTSELILKIKKPDYLGISQWEFRHGRQPINAKVSDFSWLNNFRARKYDVRPGDALRAKVKTTVIYDYDNELIDTDYEIVEVLGIINMEPPEQLMLDPKD